MWQVAATHRAPCVCVCVRVCVKYVFAPPPPPPAAAASFKGRRGERVGALQQGGAAQALSHKWQRARAQGESARAEENASMCKRTWSVCVACARVHVESAMGGGAK